MTRPVVSGTAVGPLPQNLRQANHTFWNWSTDPGGAFPVTDARIIDGNIRLYAQYRRNPVITNPAVDGRTVLFASLPVTWETLPGTTQQRLSLIDLSTSPPTTRINNQLVTGGSFTIPVGHFVAGRNYMVEVVATVSGRNLISRRVFTVGQILPTILSPFTDRVQIEPEGLLVEWQEVPGATYQFTLENITTGAIPIVVAATGTSFRILARYLIPGHHYRIEVAATVGGQTVRSWREFTVIEPPPPPNAGITVTVLDPNGWPVVGALVHIMRESNPNAPVNQRERLEVANRTNNNGVAFFTNTEIGSVGTYGINVTHPEFVSTGATSTPASSNNDNRPNFVRSNASRADEIEFSFAERSQPLRNFGWWNVLQDMHTLPYQTNSIFGWREDTPFPHNFDWHNGIDFNLPTRGAIRDHRIYSAFRGYVTGVSLNTTGMGYAVTMRFEDRDNRVNYYMRYMHMIGTPLVSSDVYLRHRTHIGNVGNTGNSFGYHLHLDVHRVPSGVRFGGSNRAQQIDPRAFFPPGFVNTRPHIAGR